MNISPTFGKTPAVNPSPSRQQPIAPNLRWAVGITTCERPGGPVVSRTIDSLIASGWSDIELFSDGPIGSSIPKNLFADSKRSEVRVHDRPKRQGAYPNFVCALTEIVMSKGPDVDAILMVQDDVIFAKNCRAYLEATLADPTLKDVGCVWSLYCGGVDYDAFQKQNDDSPGWKKTNRGWGMQGALTVVFRLHEAISFLKSESTWMHRIELGPKSLRQVDAEIGKWARANNKPAMFHHPALAQHTGEHSAIYRKGGGTAAIEAMSDRRSSATFVGEDFDAMTFLSPASPSKKPPKAVGRLGIYGPLGLSPEGFATARLAELELTRSVLCVQQAGFPMRPVSFEARIIPCVTGTNRTKIAASFSDCSTILTTVPMTPQAISWAKAHDKDIVSVACFSSPLRKKTEPKQDDPWTATLRASSLVLTPWRGDKAKLEALGARNVVEAVPAILAPFTGSSNKRGYWKDGYQGRHVQQGDTIFANEPSKVPERFQPFVFDLIKEGHDSFLERLGAVSSLQGMPQWSSLHLFLLANTRRSEVADDLTLIPEDRFVSFLEEKIRRF